VQSELLKKAYGAGDVIDGNGGGTREMPFDRFVVRVRTDRRDHAVAKFDFKLVRTSNTLRSGVRCDDPQVAAEALCHCEDHDLDVVIAPEMVKKEVRIIHQLVQKHGPFRCDTFIEACFCDR